MFSTMMVRIGQKGRNLLEDVRNAPLQSRYRRVNLSKINGMVFPYGSWPTMVFTLNFDIERVDARVRTMRKIFDR